MRIFLLFTWILGMQTANAYQISGKFINEFNLSGCSRVNSAKERLSKNPIYKELYLMQASEEAVVVSLLLQAPTVLFVNRQFTQLTLDAGETVYLASVVAPGYGTDKDEVIQFPHRGVASARVTFTLAGLCPYMPKGDRFSESEIDAGIAKALKDLLRD